MKRPSFQFYPSDWLRDTALRSCSTGARGLWIDMICFMHEGNPYGYLKVGNKVIHADNLARMVGETLEVVEGWLAELSMAGVFDLDDGVICSRRMIRDEELREKRANGGKLGGNPALKVNLKVNDKDKQKPTPSSSSSSSSSTSVSKKAANAAVSCPQEVDQQVWDDWMQIRKAKKLPLTETAWQQMTLEAGKVGLALNDMVKECCLRNWASFKATWYEEQKKAQPAFIEERKKTIMGLTRGLMGGGSDVKLLGN